MEFEITTNLETIKNQQITANFEAVSAWLDEELAPYKGMIVTADMIPSAKTYRANLRKLRERIDQYRKEAKQAVLAPYNIFEQRCKELTGKIDDAANNIDSQVKAHEKMEADAKIAEIKGAYDSFQSNEAKEFLPWEMLVNPKWENKGYKSVDAQNEIYNALSQTVRDLAAIRSMGGDNVAYLLDVYRQTHDISAVVRKNAEINARKSIEEQRRREAEALRKAQEAAAGQQMIQPQQAPVAEPVDDVEEEPVIHVIDFRVWATAQQLNALAQFMKQNGIKYGKVV